jgi:hypothetical protein
MAKEKKIGFRYFLNLKLKPHELGGENHYPVYVNVVYNRNNTTFYFPIPYKSGYVTESEFERFFTNRLDPNINNLVKDFENQITQIIRFEIKVVKENFQVKGLSEKRFDYNLSLGTVIEEFLTKKLVAELFEATKNEDVENLYSDYLDIWEVYSLLKEITPNIQDLISVELKTMLKAFVMFSITNFEDLVNPEVGFVRKIDWLQEKIVMRYKEAVLNFDGFDKHFVNESANSPLWILVNDVNIEKKEISKYLDIIDKAIVYSGS